MLLTIDVGNTNIVFGLFEKDKLLETFRLSTTEKRTADELGLLLQQYFLRFGYVCEEIEAVVIASVVPTVMPNLLRAIEKYVRRVAYVIDRDIFPALQYEGEGRLGVDRAVCCDAALVKYGAPLLVLDMGTATTIDAVDAKGWYLGGCILAGMQVSMEALSGKAAQLPQIQLARPDTFLGYTTEEQIQVGAVSGYLGGIDYLLSRTKAEMGSEEGVKVIATGGLAALAAEELTQIDVVDDGLILDGLRILYESHISG